MAAAASAEIAFGSPAPTFALPGTDGRPYTLDSIAGLNGTVIVFICNHCPYVKAVIDRLVADAKVLMAEGVGFAAICSNDATHYPADSFGKMKEFAAAHGFPFPYLHDERSPALTARSARRTSSASMRLAGCSIAAGSMPGATAHPRPAPGASWSRRCAPSLPDARRPSRRRRSAARSSGRRPEGQRFAGGEALPRSAGANWPPARSAPPLNIVNFCPQSAYADCPHPDRSLRFHASQSVGTNDLRGHRRRRLTSAEPTRSRSSISSAGILHEDGSRCWLVWGDHNCDSDLGRHTDSGTRCFPF
jgi:hypothetical protein